MQRYLSLLFLVVLQLLLRHAGGVGQAPRSPAIAPVGGGGRSGDSMMRAEPAASLAVSAEGRILPQQPQAPAHPASRVKHAAPGRPARGARSPQHEALPAEPASLANDENFSPLAKMREINEDDWDDEDTKAIAQDPIEPDDNADGIYNPSGQGETLSGLDDSASYDGIDQPVVNVTSEEDATAAPNTGPLKAMTPITPEAPPPETGVEKLGEGIGAMAYERSPTGSRIVNHDLRQRLQLQDYATVALLISVFALTVGLSCCSVYQVADDPSPAAYYSEPKNYQQRVICESNDVDAFLAAFNTQPQNVRLRIIGRNPDPGGFRRFLRTLDAHSSQSRGLASLLPVRQRRRMPVLFDVGLDMTPFITNDGRLSDENLVILQGYLNSKNHLESLLVQKKVDWPLWEDVATNIRQRLRTLGFPSEVEVRFEANDEILVYQNHKWTNFVRNRVTQALVVISIVGSVFWMPYLWARQKTTKIETRFQINVDPARYWELVAEGLSAAEGFQSN